MTPRIDPTKNGVASEPVQNTYELRLYIAGASPRSRQAVANVRRMCENALSGVFDLTVVDILQQPQAAKEDQIIAVPTLIKKQPKPVRRFIGDMANADEILRELEG